MNPWANSSAEFLDTTARKRGDDLHKRHAEIMEQQDRLLNLQLLEEIDASTYAQKATELRDEETHLSLEIERLTRERYEIADIAVKAFELSQRLREKWFEADYAAKRRILEIVCLNFSLDGVSLVPTMRKPFDMLAEGLDLKNSRGNQTRLELFGSEFDDWSAVMMGSLFDAA